MSTHNENISFEEAMLELEKIIHHLEQSDISLEQALLQFEKGTQLIEASQKKIDTVKQQVDVYLEKKANQ